MKVGVSTRRVQLKSSIQRLMEASTNMIGQNPSNYLRKEFPISIRKRKRVVRKTSVIETRDLLRSFSCSLVIVSTRTSYPSDESSVKPPH